VVSPLEIIVFGAFAVAVFFGLRYARQEPKADPDPSGTKALLAGAWVLTVGVLVLPLLFLASFVLGGVLVSRGWVRNGWAIMAASVVLAVVRIVLTLVT